MSATPTAQDMERARAVAVGCQHRVILRRGLGACEECIARALAEERERAAGIAETFDDFCFPDDIAAAIREGSA